VEKIVRQIVVSWLILGIAALLVAFAPIKLQSETSDVERFFHVEAGNFAYSPAVLTVNPGDKVTIELASTDVVHGLYVDGYDVSVIADPGQPSTLSFIANRSGTFRLRCSVTCGALHPFMIGKLQVGSNLLFLRGIGLAFLAFMGIFITRPTKLITGN
jgi:cytochrome c oxidase subunit 2